MDAVSELRVLLASGTPLLVVTTSEEPRALTLVRDASGAIPVWVWSAAQGLVRDGGGGLYGTTDPEQLARNLADLTGDWTAVLCDPAPVLAHPAAMRQLKEIAQRAVPGRTVILVGSAITVPPELDGVAHRFALPVPTVGELLAVVNRVEARLGRQGIVVELGDAERLRLARAVAGLSLAEAQRVLAQCGVSDGRLSEADVAAAVSRKAELLNADGILELVAGTGPTLDALGGLADLKAWLRVRLARGLDRADDPPRGVFLTGVPGCGKSAVAHAIAATWEVPLVLLDPGRIYRKYVGESEERFERALATVEGMAPAVLWIDEIEKGFARSGEDGGVSERVLATFLRWLQDRPAGVFVVATANDVTRLPPELTRKGRFDELFFVDLPDRAARAEILVAHLGARGVDLPFDGIAALADASEGFSGAELAAAVTAAATTGPITVPALTTELARTVPLARSRAPEITALRSWATVHARAA